MKFAIIGGTGVYDVGGDVEKKEVTTAFGSIAVEILKLGENEVVFLPRHGKGHNKPPHLINYKANMMGLRSLGVTHIMATCAVGSCNESYGPGDVVCLTDFLDFTSGRDHTFHDGSEGVRHTDMSEPYCVNLRRRFDAVASRSNLQIKGDAVYVCTQGPRFETAAEIRFYSQIGGDVVGMTNVPEVVLAKELGMCYAAYGIVSNWCTGFKGEISIHDIQGAIGSKKEQLTQAFVNLFEEGLDQNSCRCASSVMIL